MTKRLNRIEALLLGLPEASTAQNERLTRIESALDRAAVQTVANAKQSGTNKQQIVSNAEAIAKTGNLVQANAEAITANEQCFEVMRSDTNADRQRWQAAADADRAENRRQFDAQQQIAQAMLVELSRVNSRLEVLEVS